MKIYMFMDIKNDVNPSIQILFFLMAFLGFRKDERWEVRGEKRM